MRENTSEKTLEQIYSMIDEGDTYYLNEIWRNLDYNKQKDILPQIIESEKVGLYELSEIWGDTYDEIQKENIELFQKIIERVKNEPEYFDDISKIWRSSVKEVQQRYIEEILETVKCLKEWQKRRIWGNTHIDVQKENKQLILNEMEDNIGIWGAINEDTQKELFTQVLEIARGETGLSGYKIIWADSKPNVQRENFSKFLEEVKDEPEMYKEIWYEASKDVQEDIFLQIFELIGDDEYEVMWRNLRVDLKDKYVKYFLEKMKSDTDIDKASELYSKIQKMNQYVGKTIDLKIFNKDILEIFDLEKLARITAISGLQQKIIKCSSNSVYKKIFQVISNENENWVLALDKLIDNASEALNRDEVIDDGLFYWETKSNEYTELINEISDEKLDSNDVKKLIQILSQEHNYFDIKNIDEVRNYYKIRNSICSKILDEEEIELPIEMDEDERKKFAILQISYGIDLIEAENLIKKYAEDIEIIEVDDNNSKVIVDTLRIMKNIYECENIDEKVEPFKAIIKDLTETVDSLAIADLESKCINLYEKIYDKTLYSPLENQEDLIGEVQYEGESIQVYEINPEKEWNMLARGEGAYLDREGEPKSYFESLYRPDIKSHGNCKAYISQDCINVPEHTGPGYGYSRCRKNTMLLMAPWDINSQHKNEDFSVSSAKWDEACGVQFRMPRMNIDNTRGNNNEIVQERLVFDEENEKFTKDNPDYIVYIREKAIDRDDKIPEEEICIYETKWKRTKKAAQQLGLPIVIIDQEKIVKVEEQRFKNLRDTFLGKIDNEQGLSDEELLDKMITKFENNHTGLRGNYGLELDYFTEDDRDCMIEDIKTRIEEIIKVDSQKGMKLAEVLQEKCEEEEKKRYTNIGVKVYGTESVYNIYKQIRKELEQWKEELVYKSSVQTLLDSYRDAEIDLEDIQKARSVINNDMRLQDKIIEGEEKYYN